MCTGARDNLLRSPRNGACKQELRADSILNGGKARRSPFGRTPAGRRTRGRGRRPRSWSVERVRAVRIVSEIDFLAKIMPPWPTKAQVKLSPVPNYPNYTHGNGQTWRGHLRVTSAAGGRRGKANEKLCEFDFEKKGMGSKNWNALEIVNNTTGYKTKSLVRQIGNGLI